MGGGGQNNGVVQAPPASASTGGSSGAGAPQRQRVRARRGQATDPHSIAERVPLFFNYLVLFLKAFCFGCISYYTFKSKIHCLDDEI